jgi:hypothetical protein
MSGSCTTYPRNEKGIKILVGSPEGKGPLREHRSEWEDNIRIDFREME